jgi:N-acetylglucosaminyldiphosphoundecaprenol N-acetyl-beta-D-mannosaminyltransferase
MKKTIFFILQHLCIGGVEICVVNVANALIKRGYRVVFLSLLQNNELSEGINPKIEIVYLTSLDGGKASLIYKLKRRLLCSWALRKKLKTIKDAIVVSTRNEYSIIISKVVTDDNLRLAQLHHDYIDKKGMVKDFRKRYMNIDYFLILTDDVRSEIVAIMKGYNNHTKCVTVPNFYPDKTIPLLKSNNRNDIALAVGRLSSEKGFLRLVDVWKLVNECSKGKYQLYIVGEGNERVAIESRIKELELQGSVKLVGFLPNSGVRQLMQEVKVYCMSSYTEAFSLVLLEAMNNGLPQVAFDVRVGPRNLMNDDETGYLVSDGDLETYSSKIVELFENSGQWTKMSEASRTRADLFNEDKIINKWEQIFNCEL